VQIDDSRQTGELTFKLQEGGFMVLTGCMSGSFFGAEGMQFIGSRVTATPSDTGEDWSYYNAQPLHALHCCMRCMMSRRGWGAGAEYGFRLVAPPQCVAALLLKEIQFSITLGADWLVY
jgi:hypothetical protein